MRTFNDTFILFGSVFNKDLWMTKLVFCSSAMFEAWCRCIVCHISTTEVDGATNCPQFGCKSIGHVSMPLHVHYSTARYFEPWNR
ncbi:hypothetical protein VFPPC_17980 [Pochonia chlamydosporia 170]|uniref:Uncharacterized protein n=1 Tax=Pochonia chlamydosporia 170 TaxID=1380566 RepID=A0A219APT7_METCM|nr:hypothetical protein VFPPC_17980 [Pochonia chlamydosporia 170]OWT42827.1 hypothetical protein VFPPC_17980 [Pochonia chlamydosporia 170]